MNTPELPVDHEVARLWKRRPYLEDLDLDLLREAAAELRLGERLELSPGDVLFDTGDPVTGAWVVLEGTLYEWIDDARASWRRPGTFVGEVAIIQGRDTRPVRK